jgi:hypothetical protein
MKATKYIATALGIVAVLLVAGWILRNTIIERISNSILVQFDLTVTDVSLDALATNYASISYLELEHANGTIIAIDDLTLPIRAASTGVRNSTARKITIELPADDDDEPLNLAQTISQLLALPPQLPQTSFSVAELSVAPYPVIRDLRWQLTEDNQRLTALIEAVSMTANIARSSDTDYSLDLSYADSTSTNAAGSINVNIEQTDTGIAFNSSSTIDLPVWRPVSTLLDASEIDVLSGTAVLRFEGQIASDLSQAPVLFADLTPVTPVRLTYARAADAITSITVETANAIEISATYPDFQWSLRQAQASLLVSDGDLNDIPVSIVNLSCQSGTTCSADISIEMEDAVLPFANVGRFEFAATQDVTINENGVQVLVQSNATVEMSGISGPDLELARFNARLTSTAQLDLGDAGWKLTAQSADVDFQEYSVYDELGFSAQVFLDDISFSDENQKTSAKIGAYASSSQAHLGDQIIRLPGFKGGVVRQDAEVDSPARIQRRCCPPGCRGSYLPGNRRTF